MLGNNENKLLGKYWLIIVIIGALMGLGGIWANMAGDIKTINLENGKRDALLKEQQQCLDLLRIGTAVTNERLETMNKTIAKIEENQRELLKKVEPLR
jgi:hypothetical protein